MNKQQIGATIKRLRTEKGLTQQAFADLFGGHAQHIAPIEAGKYNLTVDRLERVAGALGASLELVEAKEGYPPPVAITWDDI